jgi:hypothetical protein
MSNRLTPIVIAAAAFASPLAMADQDGFRATGNEAGWVFVGTPSTLSRDEVKRDLAATPRAGFVSTREQALQARRGQDATKSTGWRYVEGEAGWVFDGR